MARRGKLRQIPCSTYRLQLHRDFPVSAAIEITPYLSEMGITSIYVSPILKARPGSLHGYDVVDPDFLNPDLGTAEEFRRLGDTLRLHGMGMIVDIVPNHMCIADSANWRWMDVLENGPSSPYARFFDIDWKPLRQSLQDKVLLPILGDQYGRVLETGDLRLEYAEGTFTVHYMEKYFPVAPRTWVSILGPVAVEFRDRFPESQAAATELESILTALSYLPLRTETDEGRIRERQREKEVIKLRLSRLVEDSAECRNLLFERLNRMNGRRDDPKSFNDLEQLLAEQAYRLSYWRVASAEINYRRFFDVDELASIRIEDAAVFDAVHVRILEGIREGWITGLRIDHPDGLYAPARYFADLQAAVHSALQQADLTSHDPVVERFYVVAEKIMGNQERPRSEWPVDGTTGYGFLSEVNGLFIDPASKESIYGTYRRFTGHLIPFPDLAYDSKRLILRVSFASELNVLSRQLDGIFQQHRLTRDFTLESLHLALGEVIACFPVYRTYISETQAVVDEEDRKHILLAIEEAKRRNPAMSASIFGSIGSLLLLEDPPGLSQEQQAERRRFIMRFQQLTGPVMAKGVEDTAFYRQFPLASLNEVGGDPENFGLDAGTFHRRVTERASQWPHNLSATSTHDTKRSEDLRARLNVLSEIPDELARALQRWSSINEGFISFIDGMRTPDRLAEYLLYQTLVGTWPPAGLADSEQHRQFVERMGVYMEKALHEAKLRTSWMNPNERYDRAVRDFVKQVLRRTSDNEFPRDIEEFVLKISDAGLWNSLSQMVLKLTCPGVPDIYQGTELWSFNLVDPDNRRPVDYVLRKHLLAGLPLNSMEGRAAWLAQAVKTLTDGRVKLFVTAVIARFRRENPDFFAGAAYVPLEPAGDLRDHVVAFARCTHDNAVIVAVGRFFVKLGCAQKIPVGKNVWRDLCVTLRNVHNGPYRDLLSGDVVQPLVGPEGVFLPVSTLFSSLPVCVLVSD